MDKILVIVSNTTLRERIDSALKKGRFDVVIASDSHQALRMMNWGKPDLIIMAENMPPIHGEKLYSRIRRLSNVPIIVLGNGQDKLAGVRALVLGADFYMTVPIGLDEMIARTGALLRRYKK